MSQYFGGIEAGGTKFVCGIGQGDGKIIHQISIPTGKPESTIFRVTDFFLEKSKDYNLGHNLRLFRSFRYEERFS